MNNLKDILRLHAKKYPLMEPCDAVKLIFQNEFGGGHLITDPKECYKRLELEYNSIEKNISNPLYEDIGNDIIRVNLASLDLNKISLDILNKLFIISSNSIKGSKESFKRKLLILRSLSEEKIFSFDNYELNEYLKEYLSSNYLVPSHSERYKQAYKPAYRIILKSILPS